MRKAVRITLCLVASLVLSSVLALAQVGGNKPARDTGKEHKDPHGRLTRLAFWRHHQDDAKAKPAHSKPAHSTPGHAKATQSRQAQPKVAQAKPSTVKPAPSKNAQKHKLHAGNMSKTPAKKPSLANATKPQQKEQGRTSASLNE